MAMCAKIITNFAARMVTMLRIQHTGHWIKKERNEKT